MLRLELISGAFQIQPSCTSRDNQNLLSRSMSRWLLNVSKDSDCTNAIFSPVFPAWKEIKKLDTSRRGSFHLRIGIWESLTECLLQVPDLPLCVFNNLRKAHPSGEILEKNTQIALEVCSSYCCFQKQKLHQDFLKSVVVSAVKLFNDSKE